MSRYNFQSTGAAAGNALQKFLMEQALMEQQRQRDEMGIRNVKADNARADEQLELQREASRQAAGDRQDTRANLEKERQFRKATTIATNGLPGVIDQSTADLLTGEGYGTLVKPGQADESGVPGVMQFAGGSQYQQSRTAAAERAEQMKAAQEAAAERAHEAQQAAAERASADRQSRETIAGAVNAGKGETQGLRNDLLRTQIDTAKDKQTAADEQKTRARTAATQTAGATIDVIKQLADVGPDGNLKLKGGTANLFGARIPGMGYIPGTDTADASAAMGRLKGRVIVDLLNEMKSQSRTGATGFGALSERELSVLEGAATQLNSSLISDKRATEELKRIYDIAQRAMSGGGAPAASGGDGWTDMGNGIRVRKR